MISCNNDRFQFTSLIFKGTRKSAFFFLSRLAKTRQVHNNKENMEFLKGLFMPTRMEVSLEPGENFEDVIILVRQLQLSVKVKVFHACVTSKQSSAHALCWYRNASLVKGNQHKVSLLPKISPTLRHILVKQLALGSSNTRRKVIFSFRITEFHDLTTIDLQHTLVRNNVVISPAKINEIVQWLKYH